MGAHDAREDLADEDAWWCFVGVGVGWNGLCACGHETQAPCRAQLTQNAPTPMAAVTSVEGRERLSGG